MGNQEGIPRTAPVHERKEAELQRTSPNQESKQLEATRITQAAIQASKLLTSGLQFGLVGRDHSRSRQTREHEMMSQGDDGSFFLSQS